MIKSLYIVTEHGMNLNSSGFYCCQTQSIVCFECTYVKENTKDNNTFFILYKMAFAFTITKIILLKTLDVAM